MKGKALICGVSGQDGAYLAKLLLEKGYTVHGTSRDAENSVFKNLLHLKILNKLHLHSMVLTDFRSVLRVLKSVQPDEVYNLSGQSSVGLSFDQPVETLESIATGTLNLLESIRFLELPIRLYNASSGECFGDTGEQPVTENSPFRPRSPYGVAKATSHWEVCNYREAYGLFACNGILFNHESPLRPERFVTQKIISSAVRIANGKNERLRLGNLHVQRDWGWAPEYVDAMWRMLQQKGADDYIIATGKTFKLEEFCKKVFEILNLDWKQYVDEDASLYRPSDIILSKANPEKAKVVLGWSAKYEMNDVIEMIISDKESKHQLG